MTLLFVPSQPQQLCEGGMQHVGELRQHLRPRKPAESAHLQERDLRLRQPEMAGQLLLGQPQLSPLVSDE